MESMELNPSDGSPYIAIAAMYAKSANSCGDSNFNKRAVFWLAASTAEQAGRIDGRLRSAAANRSGILLKILRSSRVPLSSQD